MILYDQGEVEVTLPGIVIYDQGEIVRDENDETQDEDDGY